jgi:hypothetical protein
LSFFAQNVRENEKKKSILLISKQTQQKMFTRNFIFIIILIVLSFGTFVSFFTSWTSTSIRHQDLIIIKKSKSHIINNNKKNQNEERKSVKEVTATTTTTEEVIHRSTESFACPNFMNNNPSCKNKLLSPPKYDDFPEYRWPNESSLIAESPIVSNINERTGKIIEHDYFEYDESYVSRQINNLQCFYDDGAHDDNHQSKLNLKSTTVRIYVPWKSYTYMTPYPFTCPPPAKNSTIPTQCLVTNQKEDLSKQDFVDGYLVDSNGAYVNEVYDWVRNPKRFVLIAYNTENIEGRREALKKGYGLRYLAKPWNSTWWSFFHITASYHRHSQIFVSFFHWALCRDESFLKGYKHWETKKWLDLERALKNATRRDSKYVKEELLQLLSSQQQKHDSKPTTLFHPSNLRGSWASKLVDQRNAPILFFVRNCDFASHRRAGFMTRLSKYIQIDSVGKCHLNKHPKTILACDGMAGNRRSCMIAEYTFYLCIENSISSWCTKCCGFSPYETQRNFSPRFFFAEATCQVCKLYQQK